MSAEVVYLDAHRPGMAVPADPCEPGRMPAGKSAAFPELMSQDDLFRLRTAARGPLRARLSALPHAVRAVVRRWPDLAHLVITSIAIAVILGLFY